MKKIIFIFIFFSFTISFLFSTLMLYPKEVIFDHDDRERTKSVKIIHRGSEKATYRVSLLQYKQMSDGSLQKVEIPAEYEQFANSVVRFSPRTITLYPKVDGFEDPERPSSQTIRIRKYFRSSTLDGEYRSHLFVTSLPEVEKMDAEEKKKSQGVSIQIKTLIGISVPLIVRKGELESQLKISNIKVEKTKNGPIMKLTVKRTGNRSVRADVVVSTMDGREIGMIKTCAFYLSTEKRHLSLPLRVNIKTDKALSYREIQGKKLDIKIKQTNKDSNILWAHETYTIPSV
ncbi:MAG: hypothetical protein GY817_02130 [bacterium]|nr:hypothetical protein [bacterium]